MKRLRWMIVLASLAGLTLSVSPAYSQGKGKAEEAKAGKAGKAEKEKKEKKDGKAEKEEKDDDHHGHGHDGHGHDHDGHGHDHDHDGEEDHGPAPISIEKRYEMENEKHARRVAKIDRLDALGIEKATMLREKELKRHSDAISRIHEAKTKAVGRPDGKVNAEQKGNSEGKGKPDKKGKSEGRGE